MISIKKAQAIILRNTQVLAAETVPLQKAHSRTLARDIRATMDLPPFNRATMDGYAVKKADIKQARRAKGVILPVVDTVRAGAPSRRCLAKGQAIKIMTGGVVPAGADAVVMREHTREAAGTVTIFHPATIGENIARKGEDAKKGTVIIQKGYVVTPGIVALCAALGMSKLLVYRRPTVAVVVTGNELRAVNQPLRYGKIHSSNQHSLRAQINQAGGIPRIIGVARDRPAETRSKIKRALRCDIALISGGVSAGDYDLVPAALRTLGAKVFFHKVAVKPGKPLLFAKKGRAHIFGLPGNPVSTMIAFYQFVRPCLLKMRSCADLTLRQAIARLEHDITVEPARTKIMRGRACTRAGTLGVKLTSHQGSGNIVSMAKANCIFYMDAGVTRMKKGAAVTIYYLP